MTEGLRTARVIRVELAGGETAGTAFGIDVAARELVAFIVPADMAMAMGQDLVEARLRDDPARVPVADVRPDIILDVVPAERLMARS